jgi:hypothetical protein
MLACDYCKRGDDNVRGYHIVWAVWGRIDLDHEFISHTWELCPGCAAKIHKQVEDLIAGITTDAPGKPVLSMPNPVFARGGPPEPPEKT